MRAPLLFDAWVPLVAAVALFTIMGWARSRSSRRLTKPGGVVLVGACACAAALVVGVSAARSSAIIESPVEGRHAGWVRLVEPPRWGNFGEVAAVVAADDRHLLLVATGYEARVIAGMGIGQHVEVRGRLTPLPSGREWMWRRHVVGAVTVERLTATSRGAIWAETLGHISDAVVRGTEGLAPDSAALVIGLALGDRSGQSVEVADDFRAAGLTHLLAVSGQNVILVLSIVAPITRRWRWWAQIPVLLAVIGAFAVLTRLEPSVLRASAMASLLLVAQLTGRRSDPLAVAGVAVTVLLMIDPLLAHQLGFQLSLGATLGILLLAKPIAELVPGPRPMGQAVGVTSSAQLFVAPLLLTIGERVPVASLPANLLAGPLAGALVSWSMTAGVVAGIVPPQVAAALHFPTRLGAWALLGIARAAAGLPLGSIGLFEVSLAGACTVAVAVRTASRRRMVALAIGVACCSWVVDPRIANVPDGIEIRSGELVAIDETVRTAEALDALARRRVGRISVLVVVSEEVSNGTVDRLAHRHRPSVILAPEGHAHPSAQGLGPGEAVNWERATIVGGRHGRLEVVGEG